MSELEGLRALSEKALELARDELLEMMLAQRNHTQPRNPELTRKAYEAVNAALAAPQTGEQETLKRLVLDWLIGYAGPEELEFQKQFLEALDRRIRIERSPSAENLMDAVAMVQDEGLWKFDQPKWYEAMAAALFHLQNDAHPQSGEAQPSERDLCKCGHVRCMHGHNKMGCELCPNAGPEECKAFVAAAPASSGADEPTITMPLYRYEERIQEAVKNGATFQTDEEIANRLAGCGLVIVSAETAKRLLAPSLGQIACPICNRDVPHSHSNWEVERERFARPEFEKYFQARLVYKHAGLDPAGTYGWALSWKDRKYKDSLDYWHPQVQLCWELWQQVYLVNNLDHTNTPAPSQVMAAPASSAPSASETAWLIERQDKKPVEWLYAWNGGFEWTTDSLKAIRFCRKEDANQIAEIFDDLDVHILEHEWSAERKG